MENVKQPILEAISLDHQNELKHFAELLKTKVIIFEQYSELVEKSQKHHNDLFEKIQNGLNELNREDMNLYYQTKEKIAATRYKPGSFGDDDDNI